MARRAPEIVPADVAFADGETSGAAKAGPWPWRRTAFASTTLLLVLLLVGLLGREDPRADVTRAVVVVPAGFSGFGRQVAVSPDGRHIAYAGYGARGQPLIHVRPSDDTRARALPGTDGGTEPTFSPDGTSLAFVRGDALFRVRLDGPPPLLLTREIEGYGIGPSWARDGNVYFATSGRILRVHESGRTAEVVLTPAEPGGEYRWPHLLPDGKGLLFTMLRGSSRSSEVRFLDLTTGEVRTLVEGGTDPRYLSTGHLLYSAAGFLHAAPFDLRRRRLAATPVRLPLGVTRFGAGATQFAVSETGTAVYRAPAGRSAELVLRENGRDRILGTDIGGIAGVRLSPDGRRIVYGMGGRVLVHDLDVGHTITLIPDGGNPFWSHDGGTVTYTASGKTTLLADGFRVPAQGGVPEQLFADEYVEGAQAWLPDGRLVVRGFHGRDGDWDILIASFGAGNVRFEPYLAADWDERQAAPSPDGRWMAYVSDETGRMEVHVRPFPDAARDHWQVSERGGREPVWAPDGSVLHYWEGSDLHAATLGHGAAFEVLRREVVLEDVAYLPGAHVPNYDTYGGRFVFARLAERDGGTQALPDDSESGATLVVAVNWFEELARWVPR